jgi:hypothetical protein
MFPMAPGDQFDWHTHEDDQLAWASRGVISVITDAATWLLPPSRALWIPAGVRHEVRAQGATTMQSVYVRTAFLSIDWKTPTVVRARPLLAELVEYLGDETLDSARRKRAAALLSDLLEPLVVTTIEVRLPSDGRRGPAAGSCGEPDSDLVGTPGRCERPHSRACVSLRNRGPIQQMANARPAQGVASDACDRAADQLRGTRGRVRIDERIRRRVSSRGRTHSVGLFPSQLASAIASAQIVVLAT